MTTPKNPYQGLYTAGNNHYQGVKSIAEFGAIAHANSLERVMNFEKFSFVISTYARFFKSGNRGILQ